MYFVKSSLDGYVYGCKVGVRGYYMDDVVSGRIKVWGNNM